MFTHDLRETCLNKKTEQTQNLHPFMVYHFQLNNETLHLPYVIVCKLHIHTPIICKTFSPDSKNHKDSKV